MINSKGLFLSQLERLAGKLAENSNPLVWVTRP